MKNYGDADWAQVCRDQSESCAAATEGQDIVQQGLNRYLFSLQLHLYMLR